MLDEGRKKLVEVSGLKMHLPIYGGIIRKRVGEVKAVDGVSFDIYEGETLGLVGESGCGKSTVGRAVLRLYEVTEGSIRIGGYDIADASPEKLRKMRPTMQMVFQDPQASLNPRMTVASIIGEPLTEHTKLNKAGRLARIYELMDAVGLNRDFANRYPHEVSGGQRQRIGIARALALNPYLSSGTKDIEAASLVIEPLGRYDEVGTLVPYLAAEIPTLANGGVSEDLKTITWKIKEGMLWSDGSPFTSTDVKFTADYCMSPEGGCAQLANFEGIESVEAVDPLTVKVTFKEPKPNPYGPFMGGQSPILQAAQFANCMGAAGKGVPVSAFGTLVERLEMNMTDPSPSAFARRCRWRSTAICWWKSAMVRPVVRPAIWSPPL